MLICMKTSRSHRIDINGWNLLSLNQLFHPFQLFHKLVDETDSLLHNLQANNASRQKVVLARRGARLSNRLGNSQAHAMCLYSSQETKNGILMIYMTSLRFSFRST